jgi:tape measure domain-containing protein
MTTERIDIVVREDGSREVRRNLEDIGTGARTGASGVDRLQGALGQLKTLLATMGISAGIVEIIKLTDTWANLQGRLALVTDSFQQLKQVQESLFNIAQKTRVSYESTADVFTRISRATKDMNTTDADRLKVVENINKALIVSGASTEEAHRALIQLGQGLSAGVLRGQDLNSVLEQTPRLAQAIAEGMGKTTGELKKMGEAGTLTSKAVFDALLQQGNALQNEFAQMPQTIGQSFELLKNQVLKFVGETGEANGIAGNFATVLKLVADNLNVIAAVIQGVMVYKLAEYFLTSAAAAVRKYLALVDSTNAMIAERAASVAAAESAVALAGAQLAVATATDAAIATARAEQVARLNQANANIRAAQAAMAAAEAAGVQSFALYTLRAATMELAAAEAARVAAMAELALLGQQQARVSAQIAAATAAETAATTALTAARSAGTGAAALAGRALGLLGGPIGIITTVLSLGATAWALWGSKAAQGEQQAQSAVEQTHEQIMGKLDEEIKKLKERNLLAQTNPELATPDANPKAAAAQADAARALAQIKETSARTDLSLEARTEILRVLGGQYNDATAKLMQFNKAQDDFNTTQNGDKVKAWLDKNQQYMSKTEQLAAAIKDAKKELGTAFTPEIEKRITDSLNKKDETHDALLQYKQTIEELKMQQKLQKEISDGRQSHNEALYNQGGMSQDVFMKAQRDAQLEENQRNIEFAQKQLEVTKGAGKEQVAARAQYAGELAVLAQQRLNIEQGYNDKVAGVFAARKRAEIDAGNSEISALNDKNKQLQDQITYFNMLPDAITRATIAELENQKATLQGDFYDEAKVNAINGKIEALKRLANSQAGQQQQAFDWDMAQQTGEAWRATGELIGNSLSSAFGKGGAALGKMVQGYTSFKGAEENLRKLYDERVKVAAGNEQRIAEAQQQYRNDRQQAEYAMYADMAGAAKGYFGEQTAAYKVLSGLEQAFRIAQIAMAYEEMVRKVFFTQTVTAAKIGAIATETTANAASVAPNVAADSAKASASGVAAVAKTIASLPFPFNVAAGAAVFAMLVKLGVAMKGGVSGSSISVSEQRQTEQGTGTVLGDSAKKSDSIAKAIEHLSGNSDMSLKHSAGMLTALNNIQNNISGLSALLVRGSGLSGNVSADSQGAAAKFASSGTGLDLIVMPIVGRVLDKITGGWLGKTLGTIANSIFGGKVSTLDTGLTANSGSVSSILAGGLQAGQYTDTKTSGGWFHSDKYNTAVNSLGSEADDQFTKIIKNMVQGVTAAGAALGQNSQEFTDHLNTFVVDIGKVSLKGLTGEQIQQQLEAVFSKVGDDMAKYALSGLEDFQKVGEGYFNTLVRVATGTEAAGAALSVLGVKAVDYTAIVNKQADVETEIIRQSLVASETGNGLIAMLQNFSGTADDLISNYKDLVKVRQMLNNVGLNGSNLSSDTLLGAGGLSTLSDGVKTFFDDFFSDAEKHAAELSNLTDAFGKLGLAVPQSKDAFKQLVLSFNDGTDAGNKMVGALLAMTGQVSEFYGKVTDTSELASSKRAIELKMIELSGDKVKALAESRKDELAAMDASLRYTQIQEYALQDLSDARDALNQAYEDEKSNLETVRDKFKDLSKSLKDFSQQLAIGDLSNLDPKGKYDAAKSTFDKTYQLAKAGDTTAMGDLQQVSQDFLNASKGYYASTSQYGKDYAAVQAAISSTAKVADSQADIAQKQLDKMGSMVSGILDLNDTTDKFKKAFDAYVAAQAKVAAPAANAIDTTYQNVLGRAPDAAGSAYWQNQINTGAATPTQVIDAITNSPEAKVRALYKSVFNRTADDAGVAYWVKYINGGGTLAQVEAAMRSSAEATKTPATTTAQQAQTGTAATTAAAATVNPIEAQLKALYQNLLGRTPDAAGLSYWENYLNGGGSMAQVEAAIKSSSEYLNMPKRALGGYTPAGMVKVGEYGPEYVNFDRPGMVYSAGQTAHMDSNADAKLDAVCTAVEELKVAVVRELQAANTQRGAAATQTLNKLDKVVDSTDDLRRTYERNA